MTNLRERVKALELDAKRRRKMDYDPEDDAFTKPTSGDTNSEDDVSADEDLGREHYESVGKSKLRKSESSRLDERKYGGKAVSRKNLFDDGDGEIDALAPDEIDDEDPFAEKGKDLSGTEEDDSEMNGEEEEGVSLEDEDLDGLDDTDQEIDSDEAFAEDEEAKLRQKGFTFRGSGQKLAVLPRGSDEDQEEGEDVELSDASEDQSDMSMDDVEDSEADDDDHGDSEESTSDNESSARPRPSSLKKPIVNSDREKLKSLIANNTAALASSLSASQSADAKKGAAVKKQYQTFDRYLDARIKLQKALTTSEGLTSNLELHLVKTNEDGQEAESAVQKAEQAALKLYSTIESLRRSINQDRLNQTEQASSKKRKRPSPPPAPTNKTPTSELWTRLESLEHESLPHRRQTLDKWSSKTRAVSGQTSTNTRLSNLQPKDPNLTSVIDTYLVTESDKLVKNSSSSSSSSSQSSPAKWSYNDTNFYQSLLRDLISSRSTLNSTTTSTQNPLPSTHQLNGTTTKLHTSGNLAKRDTKASKGRKIRYTVHPKLENFTVAQGFTGGVSDGTTGIVWTDKAVDEFFAGLLGARGILFDLDADGDRDRDSGGDEDAGIQSDQKDLLSGTEGFRLFR